MSNLGYGRGRKRGYREAWWRIVGEVSKTEKTAEEREAARQKYVETLYRAASRQTHKED
jgi:hypothetical protein